MPEARKSGLDRLLDGAQVTFAERGYRAASISEICARSGVGIGTFYANFDHKRQLLKRVCVERTALLTTTLTADDLLDHDRLVARLHEFNDEPAAAGLLRAWYEGVLEEPELAEFHAEWRAATLRTLAATVAEAQRRASPARARLDPGVVAWSLATLSREMAIHDRAGAPDMDGLAAFITELILRRVVPADPS